MSRCTFPLSVLAVLAAFAAYAELTYALYDLKAPGAGLTPVTVAPEALKGTDFRQPDRMLFVRDTALGTPYYMGVYEVTEGQAKTLGWTSAHTDKYPQEAAFGQSGTLFTLPPTPWQGHVSLQIPTPEQWAAYAGTPEEPCNLSDGLGMSHFGGPYSPNEWLTVNVQGHVTAHGLVDVFGNVAEVASDGRFYGGFARMAVGDFNRYRTDPKTSLTAREVTGTVDNSACLGVRLIYVPPEEITYTAKTTLGGKDVHSEARKAGETVRLAWPQPDAGHRRLARAVTPEGLALEDDPAEGASTFAMPAEDVTLAFSQKAVVTVDVAAEGEGGTVAFARKAPPEDSFDALSDREAYVGETVTLTATPEPSWRVKAWLDADGALIAEAGAAAQWEYVIDETATPGATLTFRAVFERPTYRVRVTLDGTDVGGWPQSFGEGETVTVAPPSTAAGFRLSEAAAGGISAQPSLTEPFVFAMPSQEVTIDYKAKAFVFVEAVGGLVAPRAPFVGETVTLTASAPRYGVFRQWTGPTVSDTPTFAYTVPQTAEPGSTLTFSAAYDTLPRVLVYGGTATVQRGTGEAFGEGYYSEGSVLSLSSAAAPTGYRFSRWVAEGGAGLGDTTFSVTSALRNQTVTLTAEYELDPGAEPERNPLVTRIGVTQEGRGETAAETLGWVADTGAATFALQGNTFEHYTTQEPSVPYAVLGLWKRTTDYAASVPNTETNKTGNLVLKRIKPDSETHYPTGDTYYVGVYETTVGHHKALGVAMKNATAVATGDTHPYVFNDTEGADGFVQALGEAFGLAVSRPSKAQIEGIAKAHLEADKAYNGSGYNKDSEILPAMIYHAGDNRSDNTAEVGTQQEDPYGFYDLWGNALEWLSDNTGHGGRAGYGGAVSGGDALVTYPSRFNLDSVDTGWSSKGIRGAVRPAVVVPEKVGVTLKDAVSGETVGPLAVLPKQKMRLAPQTKAGYRFVRWVADKEGMAPVEQKDDGYWLATVTEDVLFTAEYERKAPLRLAYRNCLGPAEALPGQTVTVYAAQPIGAKLLSLTVEPEEGATVDLGKGTVTFAPEAYGDFEVTATYEAPKAGYRLRLR